MCFSQYAQYAPRPVYQYEPPKRPQGAPPTDADLDENLYGPKPLPPEWQQPSGEGGEHVAEGAQGAGGPAPQAPPAAVVTPVAAAAAAGGSAAIASVSTQTVEAVVVELSNGTKLLICPL